MIAAVHFSNIFMTVFLVCFQVPYALGEHEPCGIASIAVRGLNFQTELPNQLALRT